jgi:hypothetical protein
VAGMISLIEKRIHLIWTRTRDLLACSIVPQPLPRMYYYVFNITILITLRRNMIKHEFEVITRIVVFDIFQPIRWREDRQEAGLLY